MRARLCLIHPKIRSVKSYLDEFGNVPLGMAGGVKVGYSTETACCSKKEDEDCLAIPKKKWVERLHRRSGYQCLDPSKVSYTIDKYYNLCELS